MFTDPSKLSPKYSFNMFPAWYLPGPFTVQYPCMIALTQIAATLPVGSASVERSFSQIKLMETDCVVVLKTKTSIG